MVARTPERSMPARAIIPPSDPKSFCMSTTITAVCAGSKAAGSGFASTHTGLSGGDCIMSLPRPGPETGRLRVGFQATPPQQARARSMAADPLAGRNRRLVRLVGWIGVLQDHADRGG